MTQHFFKLFFKNKKNRENRSTCVDVVVSDKVCIISPLFFANKPEIILKIQTLHLFCITMKSSVKTV